MATSVVGAVIDLYNSIPATAFGGTVRPTIFLGDAAQVTSAGAQQRPPFVVLYDEGIIPTFDSSFGGVEAGTLRVEVFARDLGAAAGTVSVDSTVLGLKYGGFAPSAKSGLDFGTFTLAGYLYKVSLKRTKEQRSYAGFLDHEGKRVHKCELLYRIVVGLSPT